MSICKKCLNKKEIIGLVIIIILSISMWYLTIPAVIIWYIWTKTKISIDAKIWLSLLALVLLSTLIALKPNIKNTKTVNINYQLIEKKDISYAGCERVLFQIVLNDNETQKNIDTTLQFIIDDNKTTWDDITVQAWGYSEKSKVGQIGYTKGMKEYSTCK